MAQLSPPFFMPRYRPMTRGDWVLDVVPLCILPGYWSGPALTRDSAILHRCGQTWMSISPLELESQGIGVQLARGHVAVCGLGLGWAAAATAARDEVTAVTVIEADPDVLALHAELDLFAQLPPLQRAKLRVVAGDALAWMPAVKVDFLLADIWLPLIDDVRLGHTRRMQANIQADAIHFWGQELVLARLALAAGHAIDEVGIATTIAETGLPLVGLELSDYAEKTAAAARQHLPELGSKTPI